MRNNGNFNIPDDLQARRRAQVLPFPDLVRFQDVRESLSSFSPEELDGLLRARAKSFGRDERKGLNSTEIFFSFTVLQPC